MKNDYLNIRSKILLQRKICEFLEGLDIIL